MFMNAKKRIGNKKGFTLIELIVVIAILGILALIAIPRLVGFQDAAKEKSVLAEAKSVASAVQSLTADGKTFTAAGTGADVYSPGEVLGYAGFATGPELSFVTGGSDALTSFTYQKDYGSDHFTVTYTLGSDSFGTVTKVKGSSVTKTTIDSVFTD